MSRLYPARTGKRQRYAPRTGDFPDVRAALNRYLVRIGLPANEVGNLHRQR